MSKHAKKAFLVFKSTYMERSINLIVPHWPHMKVIILCSPVNTFPKLQFMEAPAPMLEHIELTVEAYRSLVELSQDPFSVLKVQLAWSTMEQFRGLRKYRTLHLLFFWYWNCYLLLYTCGLMSGLPQTFALLVRGWGEPHIVYLSISIAYPIVVSYTLGEYIDLCVTRARLSLFYSRFLQVMGPALIC